jgi:hypothetical protein
LTSAVLVGVLLAGIAVAGHRQSPDQIIKSPPPRPGSASTPTTGAEVCTAADMKHLGLAAMPPPERVAKVDVSQIAELEPPEPDARPLVSAATVWAKAKIALTRGASYRLLLAVYTGPYPSGPDLLVGRQLAWVAVSDHVAIDVRAVSYPYGPGRRIRQPCYFGTRLDVFDARTGKHLTSSVTAESLRL